MVYVLGDVFCLHCLQIAVAKPITPFIQQKTEPQSRTLFFC